MSEKLKNPECIAGPPVRLVPVKNACGPGQYPIVGTELCEGFGLDVITDQLILKVPLPVDMYRSWKVAHVIEKDIFVTFNDPDGGVVDVFGHPCG
jgi:hypothetical protein